MAIRRNPPIRARVVRHRHDQEEKLMRMTSIALAVVATLGLPAMATAHTGTGNKGDPSGSSNNAGNPPGANTTQGPTTKNPAPKATTGTGIGGGTSGSSQQPNATNNPQSGTQAPDAQKGGSGSQGAR